MAFTCHVSGSSQRGTSFAIFFNMLYNQRGDHSMAHLRLKEEKVDYNGLSEHLDQRSKLYERNLHIKNSLRMQELLNEESFRKWKKLRFEGHNPPADLEPSDHPKNERL
jgi:hypothetical protein